MKKSTVPATAFIIALPSPACAGGRRCDDRVNAAGDLIPGRATGGRGNGIRVVRVVRGEVDGP